MLLKYLTGDGKHVKNMLKMCEKVNMKYFMIKKHMKTYIINSIEDLTQHKDDYGIHIKGNATINISLGLSELPKRLKVDGFLYIEAGGYIEAGESIKAGGYIKAGWFIKAGGSIEAGWFIKAGESIKAGGYIKAGWFIKAGGYIKAGESIEAGESIKAGGYIEAGESIKAGGYIEAGGYIKAGWFIKAGGYIEAGESYGVVAGLYITCKGKLSFGLRVFAGICARRKISEDEKTITCGEFDGGEVAYGILKEIGIEEEKKKIVIDGKEIEISKESYEALKNSLID